jgi:hypothetical protein
MNVHLVTRDLMLFASENGSGISRLASAEGHPYERNDRT